MKDLFDDIERWRGAGRRLALARVVRVEGSGPRDPGAAMAVADDGEVAGSVSGGCVEGAVVAEALDLLGTHGDPGRLVTFGYSDADAFAVGLTCGGTVHLFLEPYDGDQPGLDEIHEQLRAALDAEAPVALVTQVEGPAVGAKLLVRPGAEVLGSLGDADLDRVVARDALGALESGHCLTRHYGPHGEARGSQVAAFIESFAPPPRMLIFGAVDFTAALAAQAKLLGYRVTVCDPREVFATPRRFPAADEVVVAWPHKHLAEVGEQLGPRDAVCVLTHDHKFDVPALEAATRTRAGYVGAMGSRRTTQDRVERLREAGVDDAALARIHAPIGLDLGARTPEETAVSIVAEIIARRTGRGGDRSLRAVDGPIHA